MRNTRVEQPLRQSPLTKSQAHAGMFVWAALVGASFPAVELMSQGLPPLLLTSLRFAIAVLALCPLVYIRSSTMKMEAVWPGAASMTLYAFLGLCLAGFFGAMFWAAHNTTPLTMATLYVSVPLLAYTMGRSLSLERKAVSLLGLLVLGAVGALGLAWAEADRSGMGHKPGVAEAVFFIGCLASAAYPVLSKWGMSRNLLSSSAERRTLWSLLCGSILVGLLGLMLEDVHALTHLNVVDLSLLIYLGVFSSAATFYLQQRASAVLSPSEVTSYSYLIPFVSMLLLFLDQPQEMSWRWLPGSLLVIAAIVGLLYQSRTHPSVRTLNSFAPTSAVQISK